MADTVKSKRRCCKDRPRCKRCPVVCKRLERAGYLERRDKQTWIKIIKIPKRVLKAARAPG